MVQNPIVDVAGIFISRFPFEIYIEIIIGSIACPAPVKNLRDVESSNLKITSLSEGASKNQPEGNDRMDCLADRG